MIRHLPILFLVLAGCDREQPSVTSPPATSGASAPTATVRSIDFEPPPARLALPTRVLQMRLPTNDVGSYRDKETGTAVPLRAVGVNLCQTGWVVQGFTQRGDELAASPPFLVPRAVLPTGRTEIRSPEIPGQALVTDFEIASMKRLEGSLRIATDSGETLMEMNIDGPPVGVAVAPGLGPQGCFTTGYYELALSGDSRVGPVSGVWDGKRLHYLGLRLTERYGIGVWLYLEPTNRQPQNVIRGNLATVGDKPRRFPFRVVFETRETTADGVQIRETPASEGAFMAAFLKANPQGPVRLEMENLRFPEWDGPMSGVVVDVRVESLLVTDLQGVGVPVPSEPKFVQEETRRPE